MQALERQPIKIRQPKKVIIMSLNEGDARSAPRLVVVLGLTLGVTIAELVLAQITHSITLLVLVHQNIYNVLTLVVSCVTSIKGEDRSLRNTFGWKRIEVVGSIASLVFLFSLCFATMIEALQTVFHNSHLDTMHHPEWILLLVGSHIAVWVLSFLIIGGYSYNQTRAVRQLEHDQTDYTCSSFMKKTCMGDVTRDLCGCFFTLLTCTLVHFQVVGKDYSAYIDPIISMVYIMFFVCTCVPLVKESCLILLQTITANVEVSQLKKLLLQQFPGILSLHEFYIWTFTPGKMVLTGHIVYKDALVYMDIHDQVETFFNSQGFSEVTIQPEFSHNFLEDNETWDTARYTKKFENDDPKEIT